jgi:uncharacterized membrane protein HdeD (DUF308 family)
MTSTCPNNNKIFDDFLFNSGLIDKNLDDISKAYQRRRVYYTICVLLRLALVGLILQLKDKAWLPYVIGVFALYSWINLLFFRKEDNQWWSNKFQAIISILLFLSSILIIFKTNLVPTYILSLLMFVSVGGGVFQSLLIPSC